MQCLFQPWTESLKTSGGGQPNNWKHDETKDYAVYIPTEKVVTTTHHVQNVETLDEDGNRHLQKQLRRENPTIKQLVANHEEADKRKAQLTETTSNGCENAVWK